MDETGRETAEKGIKQAEKEMEDTEGNYEAYSLLAIAKSIFYLAEVLDAAKKD